MKIMRPCLIIITAVMLLLLPFIYQADVNAAGPKVSELSASGKGNKHNLSAKVRHFGLRTYTNNNVNLYRADPDAVNNPKGQEICIFCHTPHNANTDKEAPLWNRNFSGQTFSRYSSGTLEIRLKSGTTLSTAGYDTMWKPDGSSKLCLSCHDGVKTLGDVLRGGPIAMVSVAGGGGGDVITGNASFNPSTNKMKTGHHPVSFVYNATVRDAISKPSYSLPPTSGALAVVKLDKNNKMQCTTCHNAHQNQTDDDDCYVDSPCTPTSRKKAPFWVYGANGVASTDRDAVCQACHPLDAGAPGFTTPWP